MPASCDVACCCSLHDIFFPDYVQFPDDCPIIDLAVNLTSRVPFVNLSDLNNRYLGFYSASSEIDEWQPDCNICSTDDVVKYGPSFIDPESWTSAQNLLSPSLWNLDDASSLVTTNTCQNIDSDAILQDRISDDDIPPTICLSDLNEPEQIPPQECIGLSSVGALTPASQPPVGKTKRAYDCVLQPPEKDRKRSKPIQQYGCEWQGCKRAFSGVQELR